MRQKVQVKNLSSPFWKFYKEKDIEVINNGGWHFNSLLTPEEISKKLKTFAHNEFSGKCVLSPLWATNLLAFILIL